MTLKNNNRHSDYSRWLVAGQFVGELTDDKWGRLTTEINNLIVEQILEVDER